QGGVVRPFAECGGDTPTRIKWAYNTALARDPKPEETTILAALFDKQKKRYQTDMPGAEKLLAVGESKPTTNPTVKTEDLAAWTSVARTILNLHETITRN